MSYLLLSFTISFGTAYYIFRYQYAPNMDAYFTNSAAVAGSNTDYFKLCTRYYSAVYADGAFVLGFF